MDLIIRKRGELIIRQRGSHNEAEGKMGLGKIGNQLLGREGNSYFNINNNNK
jgi:ribosomal protein L27